MTADFKSCSISECDRRPHGQGLCKMHWLRLWRHGDPLINKRGKDSPVQKWLSARRMAGEIARTIADSFNVSLNTVYDIAGRRQWAWLEMESTSSREART